MNKYILILALTSILASCKTKSPSVEEGKPHWLQMNCSVDASFRGVAAVSEDICWISGSLGKVLLTLDGGKTWLDRSVPNSDTLQFRDIEALSKDTVIVMASGFPGLLFKTNDAGLNWTKVYENRAPGIFFDAMDFWDSENGIAFSDAITDKLILVKTSDGGDSWHEVSDSILPEIYPKQGGFAASGSCLNAFGNSHVVIGLGGPESTLLLSRNFGDSWIKIKAPLDFGEPSKGIFSLDFLDEKIGYAVGGDYRADSLSHHSMAKTYDGGLTWEVVTDTMIAYHYRSSVLMLSKEVIICSSRTGSNITENGGQSWQQLNGNYFSLSVGKSNIVWASGPNGTVGKLVWH